MIIKSLKVKSPDGNWLTYQFIPGNGHKRHVFAFLYDDFKAVLERIQTFLSSDGEEFPGQKQRQELSNGRNTMQLTSENDSFGDSTVKPSGLFEIILLDDQNRNWVIRYVRRYSGNGYQGDWQISCQSSTVSYQIMRERLGGIESVLDAIQSLRYSPDEEIALSLDGEPERVKGPPKNQRTASQVPSSMPWKYSQHATPVAYQLSQLGEKRINALLLNVHRLAAERQLQSWFESQIDLNDQQRENAALSEKLISMQFTLKQNLLILRHMDRSQVMKINRLGFENSKDDGEKKELFRLWQNKSDALLQMYFTQTILLSLEKSYAYLVDKLEVISSWLAEECLPKSQKLANKGRQIIFNSALPGGSETTGVTAIDKSVGENVTENVSAPPSKKTKDSLLAKIGMNISSWVQADEPSRQKELDQLNGYLLELKSIVQDLDAYNGSIAKLAEFWGNLHQKWRLNLENVSTNLENSRRNFEKMCSDYAIPSLSLDEDIFERIAGAIAWHWQGLNARNQNIAAKECQRIIMQTANQIDAIRNLCGIDNSGSGSSLNGSSASQEIDVAALILEARKTIEYADKKIQSWQNSRSLQWKLKLKMHWQTQQKSFEHLVKKELIEVFKECEIEEYPNDFSLLLSWIRQQLGKASALCTLRHWEKKQKEVDADIIRNHELALQSNASKEEASSLKWLAIYRVPGEASSKSLEQFFRLMDDQKHQGVSSPSRLLLLEDLPALAALYQKGFGRVKKIVNKAPGPRTWERVPAKRNESKRPEAPKRLGNNAGNQSSRSKVQQTVDLLNGNRSN